MVIWREVHWVWTLCIEPGKCHTKQCNWRLVTHLPLLSRDTVVDKPDHIVGGHCYVNLTSRPHWMYIALEYT